MRTSGTQTNGSADYLKRAIVALADLGANQPEGRHLSAAARRCRWQTDGRRATR